MPTSYNFFKQEIEQWFLENIPISKRILDVGPGEGTYADLLHSKGYRIDAVEIYEPYVEQFHLKSKYDNVYIKDILDFDIQDYDFIILGDILEHLPVLHAQGLIDRFEHLGKQCLVAIPYMMPQGEVNGNVHEKHWQEDLTPEVMKERYPNLVCLYSNKQYGYYTFLDKKVEKAYVLYATISYLKTVEGAVNSLKTVSDIPIIVYLLDGYSSIEGAKVIRWDCNIANLQQEKYIDRSISSLYKMLIQRPMIVKDALEKYAKNVAYIDSDSVATQYADHIFDSYPAKSKFPYFTEGIYDYLHSNGRGGAESKDDLSTTLEHPSCQLFNVNQKVRERYRQTGYFVAGQFCINFLDEWYWMCNHPEILKNPQWYAPFHEETIVNTLLWKYNIDIGLPLIYINGSLGRIHDVQEWGFSGNNNPIKSWITIPAKEELLMFYHGEKELEIMNKMIEELNNPTRIISDYPNYTISMNDDVINIKTNKKLKSFLNQGRLIVELWKNNKKKHQFIYRLKAQAFLPNPENKPQINHINGVPNTDLDNMEWVTDRENKLHAYKTGLIVQSKFPVNQYTIDHKLIRSYVSVLEANKITKVDRKSIKKCAEGEYSQAGGYKWEYVSDNKLKNKPMRILFLPSHLSTGGMPAFLLKRIEALQQHEDVEIYVVEWQCVSGDFVVHRNAIMKLVKNFYSLGEDKYELMKIIKNNQIDVVHIDEMIEHLANCPFELKQQLYDNDRTWRIVETCHNVVFKPDQEKKFNPDAYAFCTPYHMEVFKNVSSYKEVIQFPIENKQSWIWDTGHIRTKEEIRNMLGMKKGKKHVLNVGLWTKGKNQGEGLEIARKYPHMHFHFVGNRAGNFKDYWGPLMYDTPSNVTIWDERSDVDMFYKAADVFMFNSTFECSPLALREAISYRLPIIARNLPEYEDMFTPYLQPIDTDLNTIEINYNVPTDNTTDDFGKNHYELYSKIINLKVIPREIVPSKINITQHFVNNPFLEITGESSSRYLVKFFDETGVCHYENTIGVNSWVQLNRSYFTKWTAKVWEDNVLIYDKTLDFSNQRVLISFDSASLGDNIAWIPYALKFKEKHKCHVIVCTFKNALFKNVYPELDFIEPGQVVHNITAQYQIGWFSEESKQPEIPNTISLQKCASNILGLVHEEIQPRIAYKIFKRPTSKPYVTIATNSTAGCKFWQKEDWQKVIDWLYEEGYDIINVSKEKNEFKHASQPFDDSLSNTVNIIHHSELLIGLSSGLSWLAWGMGKHTLMISNFTEKDHEYVSNCTRMTDESVCHGCWNNSTITFDKGDWNWCPIHKGTPRHWECQRAITGSQVIDKLKKLLE